MRIYCINKSAVSSTSEVVALLNHVVVVFRVPLEMTVMYLVNRPALLEMNVSSPLFGKKLLRGYQWEYNFLYV